MPKLTKADLQNLVNTLTSERDHLASEVYRLTAALSQANTPAPAPAPATTGNETPEPRGKLINGVLVLGAAHVTWKSGKQSWCRIVEVSAPRPGSGWHEDWRFRVANWKSPESEFRAWVDADNTSKLRWYGARPEGFPAE